MKERFDSSSFRFTTYDPGHLESSGWLTMFLLPLQHYCWLEGSFSVVDSTGKAVTENVAYPGVKTLIEGSGERRQSHKYYQWVYFVLIIQVGVCGLQNCCLYNKQCI